MPQKRKRNAAAAKVDESHSPFWTCARCTLQNAERKRRCGACEAHRPVDDTSQAPCSNKPVAAWLVKRKRKRQEAPISTTATTRDLVRSDSNTAAASLKVAPNTTELSSTTSLPPEAQLSVTPSFEISHAFHEKLAARLTLAGAPGERKPLGADENDTVEEEHAPRSVPLPGIVATISINNVGDDDFGACNPAAVVADPKRPEQCSEEHVCATTKSVSGMLNHTHEDAPIASFSNHDGPDATGTVQSIEACFRQVDDEPSEQREPSDDGTAADCEHGQVLRSPALTHYDDNTSDLDETGASSLEVDATATTQNKNFTCGVQSVFVAGSVDHLTRNPAPDDGDTRLVHETESSMSSKEPVARVSDTGDTNRPIATVAPDDSTLNEPVASSVTASIEELDATALMKRTNSTDAKTELDVGDVNHLVPTSAQDVTTLDEIGASTTTEDTDAVSAHVLETDNAIRLVAPASSNDAIVNETGASSVTTSVEDSPAMVQHTNSTANRTVLDAGQVNQFAATQAQDEGDSFVGETGASPSKKELHVAGAQVLEIDDADRLNASATRDNATWDETESSPMNSSKAAATAHNIESSTAGAHLVETGDANRFVTTLAHGNLTLNETGIFAAIELKTTTQHANYKVESASNILVTESFNGQGANVVANADTSTKRPAEINLASADASEYQVDTSDPSDDLVPSGTSGASKTKGKHPFSRTDCVGEYGLESISVVGGATEEMVIASRKQWNGIRAGVVDLNEESGKREPVPGFIAFKVGTNATRQSDSRADIHVECVRHAVGAPLQNPEPLKESIQTPCASTIASLARLDRERSTGGCCFFYTQASQSQEQTTQSSQEEAPSLSPTTNKRDLKTSPDLLPGGLLAGENIDAPKRSGDGRASRDARSAKLGGADQTRDFPVFTTAGRGAKIKVSESSLARVASLFAEKSSSSYSGEQPLATSGSTAQAAKACYAANAPTNGRPLGTRANAGPLMFTTAGLGKRVEVSESSLAKAASLLSGEPSSSSPVQTQMAFGHGARFSKASSDSNIPKDGQPYDPQSSAGPPMFTTAGSGKRIEVSESNLARAGSLLSGDTSSPSTGQTLTSSGHGAHFGKASFDASVSNNCRSRKNPTSVGPPMFATAGLGKRIKVSESSLARATILWSGESSSSSRMQTLTALGNGERFYRASSDSNVPDDRRLYEPQASTGPPMFTTAGFGKRIEVSESDLARAVSLLSGDTSAPSTGQTLTSSGHGAHFGKASFDASVANNCRSRKNPTSVGPPMFATAGLGKRIKVSESSLARASTLLSTEPSLKAARSLSTSGAPTRASRVSFGGTCANDTQSFNQATDASAIPMFTIAGSGKEVKVSESSLTPAASLLSAESSWSSTSQVHVTPRPSARAARVSLGGRESKDNGISNSPVTPCFPMFTTAGLGNIVEVSESSLARAASLLSEGSSSLTSQTNAALTSRPHYRAARVSFGASVSKDYRAAQIPVTPCLPVFTPTGPGKREQVVESRLELSGNSSSSSVAARAHFTPGHRSRGRRVSFGLCAAKDYNDSCPTTAGFPMLTTAGSGQTVEVSELSLAQEEAFLSKEPPSSSSALAALPEPGGHTPGAGDSNLLGEKASDQNPGTPDFPLYSTAGRTGEIEVAESSLARVTSSAYGELSYVSSLARPHPASGVSTHVTKESSGSSAVRDSGTNLAPSTLVFSPVSSDSFLPNVRTSSGSASSSTTRSYLTAIKEGTMTIDEEECLRYGVSRITLEIDSTNGPRLRYWEDSFLPCSFERSGLDGPDDRALVGCPAHFRHVLSNLGCDPSLLTDRWILNHSRWIVWKLASMERRFAPNLSGNCLSFLRVAEQMKKRYEREIVGGSRSPLRKILNRDVSAKTMIVLCVSQLQPGPRGDDEKDEFFCELTDGWYPVRAVLDARLCHFAREGRIRVGTKLMVSCASLVGFADGIDPLDASYDTKICESSPALCIAANSCRLARWNAKLGFVHLRGQRREDEGMLHVKHLSDVFDDGGKVPLMDLVIVKKYPLLFLAKEATSKSSSNTRVLSEAEEGERVRKLEQDRQLLFDRYIDDVEADSLQDIADKAPDLWKQMMSHHIPSDFYEALNNSDRKVVDSWKDRRAVILSEMMKKEMDAKLDEHDISETSCARFIRVLVQSREDAENSSSISCYAMLTIWKPSDEQLGEIKEGLTFRMKSLHVKPGRFDGLVQLSAGADTRMEMVSPPRREEPTTRSYSSISRLFAASVRHMVDQTTNHRCLEENVVGVMLRIVCGSGPLWEVLLTDETGKLLRVKIGVEEATDLRSHLSCLSESCYENIQRGSTCAAFRGLHIAGLDANRTCVVAKYTEMSSFDPNPKGSRLEKLKRWSTSPQGKARLLRFASYSDVGMHCPPSQQERVIGYTAGFHLLANQTLIIQVDCGGSILKTLKFPLSLVSGFADSCSDLDRFVFLNKEQEFKIERLKRLGRILRSRRSLYNFSLRHVVEPVPDCPDVEFEVTHVAVADTRALAALYSSLIDFSRG